MGYVASMARVPKRMGAFRAILCTSSTILLLSFPPAKAANQLDADGIVQRSIEALKSDWEAEPRFNYREVDASNHGSKTYQVMMILGSPYKRVEAINGMPLPPQGQKEEQRKLDAVVARRCQESKSQTEKRIATYGKERQRDHLLMQEITHAFTFTMLDDTTTNSHDSWHLRAIPKPGYQPLDKETKVLTGMEGELWIDKETFQWIHVVAQVIHPVSIEGFLARVEPGTRFSLVRAPIAGGAWFPSKFSFGSKVRVLSFIDRNDAEDEIYSDYQAADSVKLPVCPAGMRGKNAGNQ
jgi:hypothetical protein